MYPSIQITPHKLKLNRTHPHFHEFMGKVSENENRSKIHIHVDSKNEAEKIFFGLSMGGEVEAPLDDSMWGTYFGMFRDRYGIEWIVECSPSS